MQEKCHLLNSASKMLESLKAENEMLHDDHENLILRFQTSERGKLVIIRMIFPEWTQRYNNLNEELQAQKLFQLQAESTHDAIETESFMRGNAQKSEISDLKARLSEANTRIATLEAELGSTCSKEIVNTSALDSKQNSQKSTDLSKKYMCEQDANTSSKIYDSVRRSSITNLEEQKNEISPLQHQISSKNQYYEPINELKDSRGKSDRDNHRLDDTFQKRAMQSSEILPVFDEIIQHLQAVLVYLQSEVNYNRYTDLLDKSQSSPYSRSDVCDIIRGLIVHFESNRKMRKSLNQTVERNLLPSCDHEGNDISSMTTTLGNLRSDGVEIDAEDNIVDLSAIELQNRKINDRVALAMARIQDAVDESSVRVATEVLTALANGGYGDCKMITKYDRDRGLPRTLTKTRNRDPSTDTLTDNTFPEEHLGPSPLSSDSDFETIQSLLTRFVDVMARMHILAFDLEANNSHDQSQFVSSGEIVANSGDGQKSFSEWVHKAHEWFKKFVHGLRGVSLQSEVEADLESLENEFVNNYSDLYEAFKTLGNRQTVDAIKRKCDDLESLNNELESAHVQLSNELEIERQEHVKETRELRSTCDQLKSDLEHSKQLANDLQKLLTDNNKRITNLLNELDQNNETVATLQGRLDKSESELSFHRSELQKLKSRAKKLIKIDITDVQSILTIFDSFEMEMKTQVQMAEGKRKQEEEERLCNLNESYEIKMNDMKNELQKKVEQYENKVEELEMRYENLREKLESQSFLCEESCKNYAYREKKLIAKLKAKAAESENLKESISTLQAEADILRRKVAYTERAVDEELVKRARKYPELKAIANDLKQRLVKRAELLEHSVAEAKRLRKIIHANDSKSNELLEELERLRAIIVVKNSKIQQLESLALKYTSGNLEPAIKVSKSTERRSTLRISNMVARETDGIPSTNQRSFQELDSDASKWSSSGTISQIADEDPHLNSGGRVNILFNRRTYLIETPVVGQPISVVDFNPHLEDFKNGAQGDEEKTLSIDNSGDSSFLDLPLSITSLLLPYKCREDSLYKK
ncbi:unnamed protein product [Hymenolepis diminuta]|uniref:DUF5741 domain-containing protein n=2 Tax=Hymenolepis diminuta TaxID=6216 RepID=A0A3P7A5U0_HYMDI|nr:unnamed protein product [Hymenolepis diminuta]